MEELEVRLQALSLRGPRGDVGAISFGDLTIDVASGRATRAGEPLKLGKIPFQILALLARRAPAIVSRQEVLDTVWGMKSPTPMPCAAISTPCATRSTNPSPLPCWRPSTVRAIDW